MPLKEEWKDLTSTKEIANTDFENDNFKIPITKSSWRRRILYYDYLKKSETHKGIIKHDSMGNMHSEKYTKPGFYYEDKYYGCSYSEIKRKFNYKYPILAFIFAAIFTFFSCLVFSQIGKFNIEKLFYFENNQYKEIYKKDFGLEGNEYENNILITFVTYKDGKTYNCRLLKGALVNNDVVECFSNYNSAFKKSLSENLQNEDGYSEKLYDILSKSLNKTIETYETKIDVTEYGTPKYSKIVTKYSYKGNNNTSDLNSSIENFYKVTGTNISFVIANNNQVYQPNWFLFSSLSAFALAGMFLGTYSIVKQRKDKKFLKREIENGNGKMYFEGEFPYEKYFKNDEIIEEK